MVDPMTSRSRLLETRAVTDEHATIARRVHEALAALRKAGDPPAAAATTVALERARKLRRFFAQPFFVVEPYTQRPGAHVGLTEALAACREILDGEHDDLPLAAFVFTGGMAEIRARAAAGLAPEVPPRGKNPAEEEGWERPFHLEQRTSKSHAPIC
jgi:F0F1-type ATP synthase beta subunit